MWEKIVEISINEDVVSHDVFRVTKNENERKKLMANIVFCQLGLIAEVMVNFFVKASIAIEVINKLAVKYELSNDDIDILMICAIRIFSPFVQNYKILHEM